MSEDQRLIKKNFLLSGKRTRSFVEEIILVLVVQTNEK